MNHTPFMQRCLSIAEQALGRTSPNPMVGCVIVHDNKIISEGIHEYYGGPHAEVNALSKIKDTSVLPTSTLYVSLEPCSHIGKTPPCTQAILNSSIKDIVIASKDPLHGGGADILRSKGRNVIEGVLENEARDLNKRFFTRALKKRPYVILKWAETKDRVMGSTKKRLHISSPESLSLSHRWRSEEAAILIGSTTAKEDDPLLTNRLAHGRSPLRVILDRKGELLDSNLNIFNKDARTVVYSPSELNFCETVHKTLLKEILQDLSSKGVDSVLIEGGSKILSLFIHEGLYDEIRVFISPMESSIPHDEKIFAPIIPPHVPHSLTWQEKNLTGIDELKVYTLNDQNAS